MFAARNLQKQSLKALSSLFLINPSGSKNGMAVRNGWPKLGAGGSVIEASLWVKDESFTSMRMWNGVDRARGFSANSMRSKVEKRRWNGVDRARGSSARTMRSKVERRMQKESGKTLKEIRRARGLRKKLMTEEERLIYNLRKAKKKVALLLQKLKKYELPELPTPRHDPELLTPEQMQAYKKIGYKNRNYVPVGVRGVFGGVVQNMHLHWKFHETVQVCCDNFPKEKIKEMASMLARLSGGIVVNVHNVKTIIMFRGRNYRQPKILIPINTLTKRKALFKARFEQALESQKLNIKKIEQVLRRKGVNPDDPVAMASIQRVASTFFNAIDQKEGSPYVFQRDKTAELESSSDQQLSESAEDDQEELDRFIAEIEDAADKEWAAEEAAEKEELGKIRYWNREDLGDRFRRSEHSGGEESDDNIRGRSRNWNSAKHGRKRMNVPVNEEGDISDDADGWDSNDSEDVSEYETDEDEFNKARGESLMHNVSRRQQQKILKTNKGASFKRNDNTNLHVEKAIEDSVSDDMLSDLEDAMYESDNKEGQNDIESRLLRYDYRSSSDEDNDNHRETDKNRMEGITSCLNNADSSEGIHGDFGISRAVRMKDDIISRSNPTRDMGRHNAKLSDLFSESDADQNVVSETSRKINSYRNKVENAELVKGNQKNNGNNRKFKKL